MKWTLHYHYPIQGKTKPLEAYSLENGKQTILFFVPQGDSELVKLVEKSMNAVDEKEYARIQPELRRIFQGPWVQDELLRTRWVRVTEEDMRKIYHMLFHENAERVMAEANLKRLQGEFASLQKAYELQGNALLRAQANAHLNIPDYRVDNTEKTMADLLEQKPQEQMELLAEDMRHHSQLLCQRGGCGEI